MGLLQVIGSSLLFNMLVFYYPDWHHLTRILIQ